jgi:hydroxypyruvate isomerase
MMFSEVPFLERFPAAADAGFNAVECIFFYDHAADVIAERLNTTGLSMVLMNSPHGDWDGGERGLAALAGREADFRASIEKVFPLAEATGCRRYHVMPGLCEPDEAALERYKSNVRWAGERFAEYGLEILLEPINRRDIPGFMLHDYDLAVTVINDIGLPNVKLQFDIYHRQILHGDIIRGLEALMPHIGHIQIADVPDRHEPGTGEINYTQIFEALDSLSYDGWVGCEYRPKEATVDGLGWMKPYL